MSFEDEIMSMLGQMSDGQKKELLSKAKEMSVKAEVKPKDEDENFCKKELCTRIFADYELFTHESVEGKIAELFEILPQGQRVYNNKYKDVYKNYDYLVQKQQDDIHQKDAYVDDSDKEEYAEDKRKAYEFIVTEYSIFKISEIEAKIDELYNLIPEVLRITNKYSGILMYNNTSADDKETVAGTPTSECVRETDWKSESSNPEAVGAIRKVISRIESTPEYLDKVKEAERYASKQARVKGYDQVLLGRKFYWDFIDEHEGMEANIILKRLPFSLLNYRGFGKSGWSPSDFTFRHMIQELVSESSNSKGKATFSRVIKLKELLRVETDELVETILTSMYKNLSEDQVVYTVLKTSGWEYRATTIETVLKDFRMTNTYDYLESLSYGSAKRLMKQLKELSGDTRQMEELVCEDLLKKVEYRKSYNKLIGITGKFIDDSIKEKMRDESNPRPKYAYREDLSGSDIRELEHKLCTLIDELYTKDDYKKDFKERLQQVFKNDLPAINVYRALYLYAYNAYNIIELGEFEDDDNRAKLIEQDGEQLEFGQNRQLITSVTDAEINRSLEYTPDSLIATVSDEKSVLDLYHIYGATDCEKLWNLKMNIKRSRNCKHRY